MAQVAIGISAYFAASTLLSLVAAAVLVVSLLASGGKDLSSLANLFSGGTQDLLRLMRPTSAGGLVWAAASLGSALAPVLVGWWVWREVSPLRWGLLPRAGWGREVAFGLLLGPVVFGVVTGLMVAFGLAAFSFGTLTAGMVPWAVIVFAPAALAEEWFMRGYVLQVIEDGYDLRLGVLISSVLFGLLHALNPNLTVLSLPNLLATGLVLAQAYLVTRRLWLPWAFHFSWNFTQMVVFGLPVSGLPGDGLLQAHVTGSALLTGGSFGPEGGALCLVGLAVSSLLLWCYGRAFPPTWPPQRREARAGGVVEPGRDQP